MVGAVFGQVPLAHVVSDEGWRRSLELVAVLGVILSVAFLLFVRDKKGSSNDVPMSEKVHWKDSLQVLKKPANWMLTLYSGLAFAPLAVFAGLWGNPFLTTTYHITTSQAASLTSLVFIGLGVGGPVFGLLSDYTGKRTSWMFIGGIITLVSVMAILYSHQLNHIELSVLMFLFGFGTGAFMIGFAMAKDLNSLLLAGTIVAMVNTGDAILGAITEPLVGYALDLGWHGKKSGRDTSVLYARLCTFVQFITYLSCAFAYLPCSGSKNDEKRPIHYLIKFKASNRWPYQEKD